MNKEVYIAGWGSMSTLGYTPQDIWEAYFNNNHYLSGNPIKGELTHDAKNELEAIRRESKHYKRLDPSVIMAIWSTRKALEKSKWEIDNSIGINIGSSRGATSLFEKHYEDFKANKINPLASPSTTLGNISSWVGQDIGAKGIQFSHSITCSSASHAILNAIAWLNAGFTDRFIVGGSEAPLTPFTIAQMQALKIYTQDNKDEYPCKSLMGNKQYNTMCLGEGASVFCLEANPSDTSVAKIIGFGYGTEEIPHATAVTENGDAFIRSMEMALKNMDKNSIDIIITHTPGTILGDKSEVNAIEKVFSDFSFPALTTNKWKIGHTLGASSALSMEMALLMMENQQFIPVPFIDYKKTPQNINRIMVNSIGFGGNAVSLVIERL